MYMQRDELQAYAGGEYGTKRSIDCMPSEHTGRRGRIPARVHTSERHLNLDARSATGASPLNDERRVAECGTATLHPLLGLRLEQRHQKVRVLQELIGRADQVSLGCRRNGGARKYRV